VAGDARLRLFCALLLPGEVVERLVAWQQAELHGGRLVPPENLHVTLAFLGSRPADELTAITGALRAAAADVGEVRLRVRGYRETRSVGMLTLDDESGWATTIAARLHAGLEELGVYRSEARPWLAHLTVLRFKERPRLEPRLPELGEVVPSDAAVFISKLRPGGAEYESVETVALGG
jgi:2'-5' RNA ligase